MEKKILIFRKWRPLTRDSAKFLADKLKLLPATRIIHNIQEIENSNSREALIRCLQNGTAFHNSDLSAEERLELEKDFRDENGQIQIICATTTLAMGVNLPSSVVIIPDILKPDSNSERFHEIPLTTSEYKNMSGRAGRTRYREDGISILLSNSQAEAISYWKNYINGQLDTLNPPLRFNDLKKIVLGLFASNLYKNKKEICDFLLSTYTGSIYWNLNDTSRHEFEEQINDIVEYLKKYGLLKEEGELSTTPLGTLCANSGVKIESFILLNQAISRINPNEWDIWEIIFPCLHCLELNDIIRIYIRLDGYREVWEQLEQLDPKNRQNLCDWSNKIIKNEIEVTKRIKLFFMLMDWIEGTDMVEIENRYTLEGGNKFLSGTVKIIAEHTAWMIQTLIGIAQILNSNPNFISDLQILYERVYRGVKAEGIDLHKLKVKGVTRTTIRRLVDNGFSSLDKILETPSQNFRGIINPDIAQRIQDVLIHKIGETQERLKHKQCSRLEKCGYDLKILKDMGIVAI